MATNDKSAKKTKKELDEAREDKFEAKKAELEAIDALKVA